MDQIGVSYTTSGETPVVYSFTFNQFTDDGLPRAYANSATFEASAAGTSVLGGPAVRQKYIWAISSPITNAEAEQFDAMFRAWDQDRAAGLPAACGVADETFGGTVTTSAVFSTAPSYSKFGPAMMLVSFGLTEV